jgi:hypothetical protein
MTVIANGQYARKAELVYNFAFHVTWSKGDDELVFCVVGSSAFANTLEKKVAGKSIQGRKAVVREGQSDCNIIVGIATTVRGGQGVLTVSDVEDFAKNGGMIEFVPIDNKIRFDINNTAAKRNGVKIGSQLLKLARTVH